MKKTFKFFGKIIGLIFILILVYFIFNLIYFRPVTNETLKVLREGTPQEVEKAIKRIKINKLIPLNVPKNDFAYSGQYVQIPLCIVAARNNNPDVIKVLIDKGADPNIVFYENNSGDIMPFPLQCAVMSNPNPDVTKTLLKYSDFDKIIKNYDKPYIYTPLGFDLKFDISTKASSSYIYHDILHFVRFNKNPLILDTLLKDERIKNNLTDVDIFFAYRNFATNKWGGNPEELVKIMAENGLDINTRYKFKNGNISKTVLEDLQDGYKRAIESNNRENIILYKNAIDIIEKYSK